jgi:hypothetical protein
MINFKYPKALKIADKLSKTTIMNFIKRKKWL